MRESVAWSFRVRAMSLRLLVFLLALGACGSDVSAFVRFSSGTIVDDASCDDLGAGIEANVGGPDDDGRIRAEEVEIQG